MTSSAVSSTRSFQWSALVLATFAAVLIGSVLTGCGSSEDAESATTTEAETTTVAPTTTTSIAQEPTEPWTERDLVLFRRISDGATLTVDLHYPVDPTNAPIIIGGSPALVDAGMIVVDIGNDDHLGEGPGGPEEIVTHPAFVRASAEKFGCAIRLARVRAAELGNDDPVVVLTGVSFGGGTATQVALFGDTLDAAWDRFAEIGGPPRQYDCEVTGGSTHVDAVVGMAGTYDLSMPIFDGTFGRAYQMEHNPDVQQFLASAIGANPDLKVRVIHGTRDDIPVEDAEAFTATLTEAGYNAEIITWPGGHESAPLELLQSTLDEVLRQ